jgi:MFS family permease
MSLNREERFVVLSSSIAHGLIHSYGLILPALLLILAKELGASKLELGIAANVYGFAMGLGAIPAGLASDRVGSRGVIAIAMGGSGLASILLGLAHSYWVFLAGMAVLGGFSSLYHPAALALISRGLREPGRGMGYHGMGGSFFQAVTPFLVTWLALMLNWRLAFVFFGLPGIVLGLIFVFARFQENIRKSNPSLVQANCAEISLRPGKANKINLILIYGAALFLGFVFNGSVNSFLTAFLTLQMKIKAMGISGELLGSSATTLALLVGVLAQFVGGHLTDRRNPELVMAGFVFVCGAAAILMADAKDWPLLVFTALFAFGYFASQPPQNYLITKYLSHHQHGIGFGIAYFMGFGAASFASSLSGYIAENYHIGYIFYVLGGFALIAMFLVLALMWFNRNTIPQVNDLSTNS